MNVNKRKDSTAIVNTGSIQDRFMENSVVNEIEPWKEEDQDEIESNLSDGELFINKPIVDIYK